jgi:DnaJ-class molecular chaperone
VGHANFEAGGGAEGMGGFGGGMGGFGGGFNPFGGGGGMRMDPSDQAQFEDMLGAFFGGGVRPSRDVAVNLTLDFMEAARGARRAVRLPNGRTVELDIPAGVESDMRMRVDGAGQPASGRVPAGHLYVTFTVRDDPRFLRKGPDLHVDATVDIATAALGGSVRVPTLDGRADVPIPAGAQPGDTLRLRGKGLPRAGAGGRGVGDQFVHLTVTVPRSLTARQRTLLQQYAEEERNKKDRVYEG